MKLLLIRHAETQVNVENKTHQTNDPVGLTELGKAQAQKLIETCVNNRVEVVFASPENRAIQTAKIVAEGINKPMQIVPELAERNWGELSGKPWAEIEIYLKDLSLEDRRNFVPPGGESWRQMDERLESFLTKLKSETYQVAAVITHEGALRALVPILKHEPKEKSLEYHFDNTSINIFEI
jgi:alpha-ribazole phosphatase